MVSTNINRPDEMISSSHLKLWLRTWSNDISSGVNYINDNFTLNFQTQTGTVSITSGTASITGSGTNFTTADVGKRIRISGQDRWIISVASTTSATINTVWLNEGNWTSSAAGVAYSYGFVSVWKDKSVNNLNFIQNTATAQPLLLYNYTNRRIEVSFNGTNQFLISVNPMNTSYASKGVLALYRIQSFGGDVFRIGSQHSGEGMQNFTCRWQTSNQLILEYLNDVGNSLRGNANSNNYCFSSFYQNSPLISSAWFIRNNGFSIQNAFTTTSGSPNNIGSRYAALARYVIPQGDSYFTKITHVELIYHETPSFTQQQSGRLEHYLALTNRHI